MAFPGGTSRMAKNSRDSGSSPDPDGIVEANIEVIASSAAVYPAAELAEMCSRLKVTAAW